MALFSGRVKKSRSKSRKNLSRVSPDSGNRPSPSTRLAPASRNRSEEHTSELQSLRHLVYLLSFPTRRSSDLRKAGRKAGKTLVESPLTLATALRQAHDLLQQAEIDRKSTRLNSSHLGISYIYSLSLHDALPI